MTGKTAEKRIAIPESALRAVCDGMEFKKDSEQERIAAGCVYEFVRWQRDNAPVPTLEQWADCLKDTTMPSQFVLSENMGTVAAAEWVRRMYDAPEPEPMHPVLKEWMADADAKGVDNATKVNYRRLFDRAFQAGQTSRSTISEVDRIDYYRRTPDGRYVPIDGPVDVSPTVQEVAEAVRPFADVLFKKSPIQERFEADAALKELLVDEQGDREGYYRPSEFNRHTSGLLHWQGIGGEEVSESKPKQARRSDLSITDLVMEAMTDFGEKDFTRCVIMAMNDDGTRRYLYSNARSEPELFGMIEMASWTEDVSEDEE